MDDAVTDCANPRCHRDDAELTFCRACDRRIDTALAELPELYVRLHPELPASSAMTERVSGSKAAPIPLRLDVQDAIDGIEYVLAEWEDALREHLNWAPRVERGARGQRVQAGATWLRRTLPTLLGAPFGDEAGTTILNVHAEAQAAVGMRPELLTIGRCPTLLDNGATCGRTLRADPQEGEAIRCRGCSRMWGRDEWLWLGKTVRGMAG